jgi:lysine 2,3-aminomutase
MHLVGKDVPQVTKVRFMLPPRERHRLMLEYLKATPSIRDVVVSGGDIANVPPGQLEAFVGALLRIPTIRDVRLASKSLVALPQHYLDEDVLATLKRLSREAHDRGVNLALHTQANHANQITPLVARASSNILDIGFRDVRNQGVLLDKINATASEILELCLGLLDRTKIMPYYFFMCDMIPNAEHWRISLGHAQDIQAGLMGLLPGYATPRIVCDVPYLGKRWVHQATSYDRALGISYWAPSSLSAPWVEARGETSPYVYYDPIRTLPAAGRHWWQSHGSQMPPSRIGGPS